MQTVILAAGKGTRMGALTTDVPKPLLTINGKTLLEYKLDALPPECDEVILVIGHLGDKIRAHIGDTYKVASAGSDSQGPRQPLRITYVTTEPLGTGYAVWQTRPHLTPGRFMVMNGDDLYDARDIKRCLEYPAAGLVHRLPRAERAAVVVLDPTTGAMAGVKEATECVAGDMIATGLYVLHTDIFDLPLVSAGNGKEEFGLPQTLFQPRGLELARIQAVESTVWHAVTAPSDLVLPEGFVGRG